MLNEQHFSRSACPIGQLEWFVNRTLSVAEKQAVEAHLRECALCRADVAAWTALRRAMGEVSVHTPEPRADLFALVERQLNLTPQSIFWSWLCHLLQLCWLALCISGEYALVQARLLRRDLFWMPLLIVPLAASIIYWPQSWLSAPDTAALWAALFTALGMAFLYGQRVDPAREITLATATSPRLVLAVRCCLVFGYDLLLNCGLVLPFLAMHSIVTPLWFLTNWLAPLCCLSALALLLSVVANAATAVIVCVFLWGLRILSDVQALLLGSMQPLPEAPWQQQYEHFWHQGPLLFLFALLAVVLAFMLLERKERFAR